MKKNNYQNSCLYYNLFFVNKRDPIIKDSSSKVL